MSNVKTTIPLFFKAASHVQEVVITGTFDNWERSRKMEKATELHGWTIYFTLLELDNNVENQKILFKFIQDGEWCCSEDYQKDYSQGYENHSLLYTSDYKPPLQFQEYVEGSMKIEEKLLYSSFERNVKDSKLYGSEDIVAVPLTNLKKGIGKKIKRKVGKFMLKWVTFLFTNFVFPKKPKCYKSMYVPIVRKPSQS